jgi:hypothetical protein
MVIQVKSGATIQQARQEREKRNPFEEFIWVHAQAHLVEGDLKLLSAFVSSRQEVCGT